MYLEPTADEIIERIIYNFLNEKVFQHDFVQSQISESPSTGIWGVDTYEVESAEFTSNQKIRFEATCKIYCHTDEDSVSFLDSFSVNIKGTAKYDGEDWEINQYEVDPQEFDDYLDEYSKNFIITVASNKNYYETFLEEIENLKKLLAIELEFPLQNILYRQIYIGSITCLETYLLDALVQEIISNDDNTKRFTEKYEFSEGKQKVEIRKIFEYVDNIKTKIKEELSDLIYHNLNKIGKIYEAVLQIKFNQSKELFKAISIRHDLVHRNGKTKEGEIHRLSSGDVEAVINNVCSLVNDIERQIHSVTE